MSSGKEGFAARWARTKRENALDTTNKAKPVAESEIQAGQTLAGNESSGAQNILSPDATPDHVSDSEVKPLVDSGQGVESKQASQILAEQSETQTPLLTDADMPPLESLDGDSDVSGFFNKGVSSTLRKAALRRIFSSPRYNVRDGLNDYDGDYTVFEPLGDTVTADMKYHAARKEAARLAALEEEQQLKAQQEAQAEADVEAEAEETETQQAEAEVGAQETETQQLAATTEQEEHAEVETLAESDSIDESTGIAEEVLAEASDTGVDAHQYEPRLPE